ncbi:MAG: arsenic metallochaperone ArsD family protein [Clostridiaceae bacterium]|nr:arsenic metallochaperone ArsD family protein [Clostridiaceae bacterium]
MLLTSKEFEEVLFCSTGVCGQSVDKDSMHIKRDF